MEESIFYKLRNVLKEQKIVFCYSGYMTENILTAIGETIPGGAYAGVSTQGVGSPGKRPSVETVGGSSSGQNNDDIVEYQKHPITGELVMVRTKRVSRNSRKGETVHRVLNPEKLGTINND